MYHLKTHPEVNQLQLLLKNLTEEVTKVIVQNNQINQKMYPYNFEKVSLKLHKYAIDFMDHLTIKQSHYSLLEQIKSIFRLLNQASKDRKARSSRTYLDDESFGGATTKSQFMNGDFGEMDDQEEVDLIEQFMIKRNHEIQSNMFGDVDQSFKNKERKRLEEFLNHADIHAKSLEVQLKNSTQQRKKISNSFRLGGLTPGKTLMKKTTFDLQRINEMTNGSYKQEITQQSVEDQFQQASVQTIFTAKNINWDKILTYCIKKPTPHSSATLRNSTQSQEQITQTFDMEIFGNFSTTLQNCFTQTQGQPLQVQVQQERQPKTTLKLDTKRQVPKRTKTVVGKTGNQKRTKTKENNVKEKQSKAGSVHTKNQKEEISLANSIVAPSEAQKIVAKEEILAKKVNLQIYGQVFDELIHEIPPKMPTTTTFEALASPSKKSMKALELKELIFEFTSKKQLNKKQQHIRSNKKNKSIIGEQKDPSNRQTMKDLSVNESQKLTIQQDHEEERTYQTSVNIEEGLVRRKLEKKNTWKGSTNSSNSILKSSSKLHQLKTDQNIKSEHMSYAKLNPPECDQKLDEIQQTTPNPIKKPLQRRTSNFKQMYGNTNKVPDKKLNLLKRNTLDTLLRSNELKKHFGEYLHENPFEEEAHFKNPIQEQQVENSCRNTQEVIPQEIVSKFGESKDRESLWVGKSQDVKIQFKEHSKDQGQVGVKQQASSFNGVGVAYKKSGQKKLAKTSKKQSQPPRTTNKKHKRVRTIQNEPDSSMKQNLRVQRNSATVHELSVTSKAFMKKTRKHNKNNSQELPDLSGCRQKLSDIKSLICQQVNSNNISSHNGSTPSLLKRYSPKLNQTVNLSTTISTTVHETSQNSAPPTFQPQPPSTNPQRPSHQQTISILKRLFMTNSYRDRLLLYLSMIQVTHERYCGKNCEHIKRFLYDMTGPVDSQDYSVAEQLMKMYQNKTGKFDRFKFFNMTKTYDSAC